MDARRREGGMDKDRYATSKSLPSCNSKICHISPCVSMRFHPLSAASCISWFWMAWTSVVQITHWKGKRTKKVRLNSSIMQLIQSIQATSGSEGVSRSSHVRHPIRISPGRRWRLHSDLRTPWFKTSEPNRQRSKALQSSEYLEVSWNRGTPKSSILYNGVFHGFPLETIWVAVKINYLCLVQK